MNIILRPIPSSKRKSSLLYAKILKDSASLVFYIDDIFEIFITYHKQYIFLRDYSFPCMVWSKLKFVLFKLKRGMTKIFALGKEYEIKGRIKLKSDKIEKILTWPIS